MKKIFFTITILFLCHTTKAQNTGVEKSIYSIQTGVLGVWANNEVRLSNEISLKSELGVIAGFRGCSDCDTQYALIPEFTIEPRWYYNINKRNIKGKRLKTTVPILQH